MRFIFNLFIIGIVLVPLICSTPVSLGNGFFLPTLENIEKDIDTLWTNFKKGFGFVYNTTTEEVHRFKIFADHVKMIIKHNLEYDLGIKTYRVGLNKFSALSNSEFREKFNGFRVEKNSTVHDKIRRLYTPILSATPLPLSVDWRDRGIITPVKNQAQCGACWAFSAAGALESYYAQVTGKFLDLSEQQLIDCAKEWGSNGCFGGYPQTVYQFAHDYGGITSEQAYPFYAQNGQCRFVKYYSVITCDGFVNLPSGDENALTQALAYHGPVSIGIDASLPTFQHYQSGVFSDAQCSSTNLDHAVLAVGYGVVNDPIKGNQEYYILKNSWTEGWGENGFMRIARNKNNMCGLCTDPSYPIVSARPMQTEMPDEVTTEPTN